MLRAGDRLHIGEYTLQFVHSLDREDEEGTVCGDDPGTEIHHLDRIVTTLMVDIRGYSQLCITVAPDIMDKLMDEWISTLGEIVQANGSTIDKFIGDAVMSGWVHPPNKPATLDSALNALRQIVKATQAIGQKYEVNLRIGAGISTGRAKVGFYGEQDYTAMGDAINLAERLEKATKELGSNVCICEASYEVSDLLKLRRATIVVKGIGQVTCWHGMFDDI
jgi:adenylate cyclase